MSLFRSPAPNSGDAPRLSTPTNGLCPAIREACFHRVRPGLELLLDAACYARDTQLPLQEFAVDVSTLSVVGLMHVDLLWLMHRGYLAAVRTTGTPLHTGTVHLTVAGVAAISEFLGTARVTQIPEPVAASVVLPVALLPVWDEERRELRWGDAVVKRFRVPAPNQELILCAFQEEGWPPHIDDPLPHLHGVEPKRRLHDTIVALNRHRNAEHFRFSGDGRGLGVSWIAARDIS